jgi:quercetin dioxygenase-like cupin family protein
MFESLRVLAFAARALSFAATATFLAAAGLAAQHPTIAPPSQWAPAPLLFPRGARIAVISGDPFKAEPLTTQLSFPDGYRMPPHFHPFDEHVEVLQGTFLVGMGDQFDPKKMQPLAVGDTATAPAGVHHYAAAKGPTIISVSVMGPYVIDYVNHNDQPWSRSTFPYGY